MTGMAFEGDVPALARTGLRGRGMVVRRNRSCRVVLVGGAEVHGLATANCNDLNAEDAEGTARIAEDGHKDGPRGAPHGQTAMGRRAIRRRAIRRRTIK